MISDGFSIGSIFIRYYSIAILFGVIVAYYFIIRECRRLNVKTDFMFNLIFWGLIVGILGARIYYVLFNLDYYLNNLGEIYKIWHGGLAIHGGIIFGLITVVMFCKRHNVNTLKILDILAPGVIIAQACGRWGNFFNQEAFGSSVAYETLIKLKIIPQFIIDNMYIDGSYHLPMFYFESLLCILGFIIMIIIRRNRYIKDGQVFSFYMIWYGIIRFGIEAFRTDSLMLFDIKVAQLVSVLLIIAGFYIVSVQNRKPKLEELYNKMHDDIKY